MALNIQGQFKNSGGEVEFNLPVISFREEGLFFFYTPVLDLTGYGKTEAEAQQSFNETLSQFFDYATNKKTLFSELEKLGWKTSNKKKPKAPSLIDMINSNEYLAGIFEEKEYQKSNQTVRVPSFV
jgi:hypothetical protein